MDLLPRTEKEFTDPLYWKRFFEHCESSFEWYGSYSELSSVLEKYIRPTDSILQIGCGNSDLAERLHDNGFKNVHSIDIDAQVIAQQRRKHAERRPSLVFEHCSAANIGLAENSINVVVDKGTLDALLPSESSNSDKELVDSMFKEIDRCLAPFGRYIVITLAQKHIIQRLFDYFGNKKFMIRVQKCDQKSADFSMPVFAIVVTKFKTALSEQRPIEFISEYQHDTVMSINKLLERICAAQQMNWFKHFISRGPVEETSVKICSIDGAERYELIVVDDRALKPICKYGAFIVPFGRENDWLFATQKGRIILRRNCELHRLVVIRLFRTQQYGSLEDIQKEVNAFILDFMPRTCTGQKINFLSLGSTDVTENIESGHSEISGKWSVEHVRIQDTMFRRLVFLDSSNLIQSEAEVKKTKVGQWQINWSDLSCQHHKLMLVALELWGERKNSTNDKLLHGITSALESDIQFALLGLGGGILAKFIHDKFKKSNITAVELDKEVYSIALKHFDFPNQSDRLHIVICDALDFLRKSSNLEDKYDVLLVDLSGAVGNHGLYCPPPEFVTVEVLFQMKKCLHSHGVLSLNLVTRDDLVSETVKRKLSAVFSSVYSLKGDEDINEVLICLVSEAADISSLTIKEKQRKRKSKKNNEDSNKDGTKKESWISDCVSCSLKLVKYVP